MNHLGLLCKNMLWKNQSLSCSCFYQVKELVSVSITDKGSELMVKIIIIEDTETIREELKTFLTQHGYEVVAPMRFEHIISDTIKKILI
jgi:hypothetical protein